MYLSRPTHYCILIIAYILSLTICLLAKRVIMHRQLKFKNMSHNQKLINEIRIVLESNIFSLTTIGSKGSAILFFQQWHKNVIVNICICINDEILKCFTIVLKGMDRLIVCTVCAMESPLYSPDSYI